MKYPKWLDRLGPREEKLRAAHGLTAKKDGWYKTFDGKTRYICKPSGVAKAVELLPMRMEAIRSNGQPTRYHSVTPGLLTLGQLGDMYFAWLKQRLDTGIPKKLARRTYDDVLPVLAEFIECAGEGEAADSIGEDHFTRYALKHLAPHALSTRRRKIIYVEAFARWAAPGHRKAGLLTKPWNFGPDFVKPSDSEVSTSAADSDKVYTPKQLRGAFLRVRKSPMLRAAGWLALCCAFGPKDLGTLPEGIANLDTGFIIFPRGKTGVRRLCWMTRACRIAVKRYLEKRPPECTESAKGLLFRTSNGLPYYREATGQDAEGRYDGIGNRWWKLTRLPITGLRSTFAQVADDNSLDQRAIDLVMGHQAGRASGTVRARHYARKVAHKRVRRLTKKVVRKAMGH